MKHNHIDNDIKQLALDDYLSGNMTIKAICGKYKISQGAFNYYKKKNNDYVRNYQLSEIFSGDELISVMSSTQMSNASSIQSTNILSTSNVNKNAPTTTKVMNVNKDVTNVMNKNVPNVMNKNVPNVINVNKNVPKIYVEKSVTTSDVKKGVKVVSYEKLFDNLITNATNAIKK